MKPIKFFIDKEYIGGNQPPFHVTRYRIQFKVFGLFWVTFYQSYNKANARELFSTLLGKVDETLHTN